MIPMFITVTEALTGTTVRKRLVNMAHVVQIVPLLENEGCVLRMDNEQKLAVRESLKELDEAMKTQAIDIRVECWKKIGEL